MILCFDFICNIVLWLGYWFCSDISDHSIKKCTFTYKWFNGVQRSRGQIKISELPEKICSKTQTKGNTEYQVMMIITEILDHISMRRNVDGLLELISLWNWLHQSIMCQNKSQIFSGVNYLWAVWRQHNNFNGLFIINNTPNLVSFFWRLGCNKSINWQKWI